MDIWLQHIKNAQKTVLVDGGMKKVHYKFEDGREMAEEYNMDTKVLLKRAWKNDDCIRSTGRDQWRIEIGDPDISASVDDTSIDIRESNSAPLISARMTKNCIEWRIRNLPYPIETYSVLANNDERCIVVRTSNKKFFKKIFVPDLDRLQLPIDQNNLAISHKFNTLIISYKKPVELLNFERLTQEEINRCQPSKEGPVQCPTS